MKLKITEKAIEAKRRQALQEGRDIIVWDTELQGFGAKASAHGSLSWLLQKWVGGRGGKAKRIVLGRCPPMSLEDARREASAKIGDLSKGLDIFDARRPLLEQLESPTLLEAWNLYFEQRAVGGRFWHELRARFDKEVIPKLGWETKVASITKAEIRHLIETKQKDYPAAARTMFEALRPFFKWCAQRDIISASPMQGLPIPELPKARDRVLTDHEIKVLWTATLLDPLFGPFFRLLLLTGQRREEVSGMQWKELDLDKATWVIPKERTKNGKEHLVHLSPQAMKIITTLAKSELDSSLLLNSTVGTKLSGYSKAKNKLDTVLNFDKPWRIHDLRRTAASGMASLGFQPHIIERLLNHLSGAQGGLVSVYQRHEYLPERKRALEAWGTYVENLVSEKQTSDNVIPLVRA